MRGDVENPFGPGCAKSVIIAIPGLWALNSAVECHLHTVEVIGSNPIAPTIPEMPEGN